MSKQHSTARLSFDDLGSVAGGLNEFAHRSNIGDAHMLTASIVTPGGAGGIGSGIGGGASDLFGILGMPGPAINVASGGSGGTGAGAGPVAGFVSGWDSANSVLGGGATGAPNGAGLPNVLPGGVTAGSPIGVMTPAAMYGAGPLGNGGDYSPLNGTMAGPYNPIGVGFAQGHNPVGWDAPINGVGASGPNGGFAGAGGATGIATSSFEIRNWGDPHVNISINGQDMGQIDHHTSINGFEVFHNTVGGATNISTVTTSQEPGTVSWNKEIDITGANGNWAVAATNADADGDVDVMVKDAYGVHELAIGQSIRQMDGSVITNTGDKLIVQQRLLDGGSVTTEVEVNDSEYLDMKTTGQGNAGLGGFVVDKFDDNHQVQANVPVATGTVNYNTVGWRS